MLDLGACKGDFSKGVTIKYGCKAIALEPFPVLYNQIEVNENIKKLNYAISNNNGEILFYESSLETAGNIIAPKPNSTGKTINVKCITLKKLLSEINIKKIDILKIDIEGAEKILFDNLTDAEILDNDQITIEFHDSVTYPNISGEEVGLIISRLRKLGLKGFSVDYRNYDWLFVNSFRIKIPFFTRIYLHVRKIFNVLKHFIS
ncbi:MAG: hypothetical protein ACD_79C00336G0004 [uncultured bacterium]|nr:MAG: hypothetical protein ACD_79C00336G0004 [uncultured bacterium]